MDHNPDLILIEDSKNILNCKNDIEIVALSKSSSANDLMYSLKSAITQFGQSQYLRKLTQENEQIAVEFKLILIARNGIKVSESFAQDSMKDAAGNLIIRVGDEVKIMVKILGPNLVIILYLTFNQTIKQMYYYPNQMIHLPIIILILEPVLSYLHPSVLTNL